MNLRKLAVMTCMLVASETSVTRLTANPPPNTDANPKLLLGTWKLVSGKYGDVQSTLPEAATTLRHITATHYTWLTYDKNGEVTRIGGGLYAFDGKTLETTLEYGVGADLKARKGKRQAYQCRIEGKTLYQSGALSTGLKLEEVWEFIEK